MPSSTLCSPKLKILLTGASGFIGSNFITTLHSQYDITAIVRQNSDISRIQKYCAVYYYENLEQLIDFMHSSSFDGVVHLATLYKPSHTPKDIYNLLHSNITFGTEILESLRASQSIRFFINTITFSQFNQQAIYEPASFYDASKQAFCDIVRFYSLEYPHIKCINLLLYNSYGANDTREKIFNLWAKISQNQESLDMSGGEQFIDISHIDDIIAGFDKAIKLCAQNQLENNAIYTLENTPRHTLKELGVIFEHASGKKLHINWGAKPYRVREKMDSLIHHDNKHIYKLPDWKAKKSLQNGIKELIQSIKETNGGGGTQEVITNLESRFCAYTQKQYITLESNPYPLEVA
ncbi:NAD-dependent epimerase/dehydratase family protein [Helicobacter fennelliae]|uniref:WbcB n=1 Tax=Helicobacter fennelliae MRY12-0050 TaxID=1325130 RepID=T1DUZ6_9HELI|nr:NAD-dependent epimerase/dehydratase family protein [Helicobacter fennelliae]GAD18092.1 WbcB [Helicobacter fennelliae MRY12-0050]STP06690.1 ADP-glyceromanno-heptose 6-epimerase [Helicobacter fennelliae]